MPLVEEVSLIEGRRVRLVIDLTATSNAGKAAAACGACAFGSSVRWTRGSGVSTRPGWGRVSGEDCDWQRWYDTRSQLKAGE